MQTVGDFDENNADVTAHCHEHLAHILHLLVLFAGILNTSQLCNALNYIRHGRAELLCNVVVSQRGVLYAVVQQRGDDRVLVQPQLNADLRGRYGMGYIV